MSISVCVQCTVQFEMCSAISSPPRPLLPTAPTVVDDNRDTGGRRHGGHSGGGNLVKSGKEEDGAGCRIRERDEGGR